MSYRVIVIPRWSGTPQSDWYPWFQRALAHSPAVSSLLVGDMPEPSTPTIPAWSSAVRALLGEDPHVLAKTIVIGHSVGCRAVLHALAELPQGCRLHGTLCVAGWWEVDKAWDSLLPWLHTQPDLAKIREASPKIVVLLSDNDPFTADAERNALLWQERLHAHTLLLHGAKHFNATEEPAVLDALHTHFLPTP